MQLNIRDYDVTITARRIGDDKPTERNAEEIVFALCLLSETAARYSREHGEDMFADGAERIYRDLSAAVFKNGKWKS